MADDNERIVLRLRDENIYVQSDDGEKSSQDSDRTYMVPDTNTDEEEEEDDSGSTCSSVEYFIQDQEYNIANGEVKTFPPLDEENINARLVELTENARKKFYGLISLMELPIFCALCGKSA